MSQALLPPTFNLDESTLAAQGELLLQDAVQLLRFEQTALALPRAKLATQLAPQDFRTWFLLGSLYVQNETYADSVEVLERALSLLPADQSDQHPGLFFTLGSAYFQNQRYTDARQVFKEGLKVEESVEAWFDLGNTDYKLRNYREAIRAYRKAVKLEAKFWPAINNIGLVEYEQGNVAAAVRQWQAALAVDEKAVEPLLAIAVAQYRQGQEQEALKMAETALLTDPSYGDLEFLRLNLWGDRLVADTITLFEAPQIRALVGVQ